MKFDDAELSADLFIAYYRHQLSGSEMIASGNRVFDEKNWKLLHRKNREVRFNGMHFRVIETRLHNEGGRRLIWHWYWIDGRFVSSHVMAKLLQAKVNLLFGDRRAAVIAISKLEYGDRSVAADALQRMGSYIPDIKKVLSAAAGSRPDKVSCD